MQTIKIKQFQYQIHRVNILTHLPLKYTTRLIILTKLIFSNSLYLSIDQTTKFTKLLIKSSLFLDCLPQWHKQTIHLRHKISCSHKIFNAFNGYFIAFDGIFTRPCWFPPVHFIETIWRWLQSGASQFPKTSLINGKVQGTFLSFLLKFQTNACFILYSRRSVISTSD